MAAKSDPRKAALLAGLVVVLAVVIVYRLKPALVSGVVTASPGGVSQVGSYEVPQLGWAPAGTPAAAKDAVARSLFTFGAPPTPTPDRRPTPTPPPTLPPRPVVIPTPPGILLDDGTRLPLPPSFPLTFLGWLGPDRLPIGVFRDSSDVVVIARGETVQGKFILREVGPTSVTIGFVGYPDSVSKRVPISQ